MADPSKPKAAEENELADFEHLDDTVIEGQTEGDQKVGAATTYSGVRLGGFKDFLLKVELLHAIQDASFEHPSEVQHQCIPTACLGQDVLCQAKSGMGKTAVFVIAVLQRLQSSYSPKTFPKVLIITPTKELAHQTTLEFQRFSKHLPLIHNRLMKVHGGSPREADVQTLKTEPTPIIVTGTPGRVHDLVNSKALDVTQLLIFILDECDKLLDNRENRTAVQGVFLQTSQKKQVMMFSATVPEEVRIIARKFMRTPLEIYVDSEKKLTLHGLTQYYVQVLEENKTRKLIEILDQMEFNQVIIFTKTAERATILGKLLADIKFPTAVIHSRMNTEERIKIYNQFKASAFKILVATDLFGRGIDIERVTLVVNYDCPEDFMKGGVLVNRGSDTYLHRVGRAGRFGTTGQAVTFISSETDAKMLNSVQNRFEVKITQLTKQVLETMGKGSTAHT
jgi:ATP-dependent RNA helicase UAP56/SUB2